MLIYNFFSIFWIKMLIFGIDMVILTLINEYK